MMEQQKQRTLDIDTYTGVNFIEPFNNIWYLNCLMHGVAQIANFHNILPCLFENDYFEYKFDNSYHYPMLTLQTKHFGPWTRIFEDNGINVTTQETENNCLIAAKEAIRRGAHVILPVDCYFEDIRPDTFQKKHLAHYLVIYGYDDSTKEFLLLEHNYENDLRYKHKRIKYSSAITAYHAYSSLLNQNKDFFLIFIKKPTQNIPIDTLKGNIYEGINKFLISLPNLYRFCDDFCKVNIPFDDEQQLLEYIDFYAKVFENIYAAKKYQIYFYNYLLRTHTPNVFQTFSDAGSCSDWSIIMGMFCRCVYKKDIPRDFIPKISKHLHRIIENERRWENLLTNV